MTDSQKKRAREIITKRKELDAKGKLTDLLLDFWEQVNFCYEKGWNCITSIYCISGGWAYYDAKEQEEIDSFYPGYAKLSEIFHKIEQVPREEIFKLKGAEAYLQQIGFKMSITEDEFKMSI